MKTQLTAVLAAFMALAPFASAQLLPHGSLGPISTTNGYPSFVTDVNGVSLDLPAPAFGNRVTPPTLIFDDVLPGNAISEAAGFGTEAFVYLATATSGQALLVLGIEAAYREWRS